MGPGAGLSRRDSRRGRRRGRSTAAIAALMKPIGCDTPAFAIDEIRANPVSRSCCERHRRCGTIRARIAEGQLSGCRNVDQARRGRRDVADAVAAPPAGRHSGRPSIDDDRARQGGRHHACTHPLPLGDHPMNSRHIEIFAAVMKAGTISRAAEVLGVTQPGVSRTVAELEASLGFALFDRVRNRIIPTPEAQQFYREVQAVYRGMDALRATAARIRDQGAGQLRIGSLSALGASLVPRALSRFRDVHPTIAVTLMVLPSRDVRDGVASGAFDIGLVANEIDVSGVRHQPFTTARQLCAMPPGHALAMRDVIRPWTCTRCHSSPTFPRIARGSASTACSPMPACVRGSWWRPSMLRRFVPSLRRVLASAWLAPRRSLERIRGAWPFGRSNRPSRSAAC